MQLGRKRRTPLGWPAKTMLIMKLTAILMLVFSFQVNANIFSQKVTLEEKGASLQKIFRQIHRQTGYQFFYQDDLLDKYGKVDISVRNVELQEALKKCFNGLPLTFQVVNKTIIVNAQQNSQNVVVTPEVIEEPAPPPAEVRGIVLNEKSEPLEGISVMIKGTQRGTVTRAGGLFNLTDVNDNDILIFTGVNIETQEVAIRGRAALSVYVKSKVSQLDEVQVIGYGKTTQRLSTSSVSSIKAEAIEKQPVANPIQALQGRMAGVAITQTGGSIGSGVDIQVRGVGTIQSGNQPLIIVDGAILPEAHNGLGTALGGYMTFGSTSMNTINPADIESIDVLKDADATAIYGSRGANGVILITTKKAKLGTTRVTADISTWINSPAYMPEAMSLPQYLQMRRDAFAMGNHNPTTGTAINPITPNANNAPDLLVWDTTKATTYWPDFEYGNRTPSLNAQLSLSGGDRRLNFYASGAYQKQNDITRGSPFQERISANLGINHTSANDRLRINLNTSFISTELQPSRGGSTGGTLASMPPNMPMENEDGSPWWPPTNITQNSLLLNPMATEEAQTSNLTSNFIANLDLSYKIYKGISFKTLFGYNYQQGKSTSTTPSTSINPLNPGSTVPSSSTTSNSFRSFNFEPQLTYTGKISRGKIDALLGSTFFDRQRDNYNLQLAGYTSDLLLYSWSAASTVNSRTNSSSVYRFNSVFSRVNYNWDNKYLINLTYRRDGSSRFGPKKQWGDFWAVGGAWLFTNEEWMKNKIPGLSFGKLRASYGVTGNDNIADYRWTSLYASNQYYNGASALYASYLADSSIGWETSKKLDLAIELGFLNDRIILKADWFNNISSNMLVNAPSPSQTGFTTFTTNLQAEVQNSGWEFDLTTINLNRNSKLQWRTNFNLSLLENKLKAFPDLDKSAYAQRLKIGLPVNNPRYPLNAEWSQIYEGINPETGLPIFTDLNGDGLINNNDRTYIGSTIPRTFGGLGNVLSYKGFELDIFFQFSQQSTTNWMFNYFYPGQLSNPVNDVAGNYWRQPGDVTKYPRLWSGAATNTTTNLLSSVYPLSSAALTDLMYVRLKNLSLSYSLPTELISKAKINRAVIYVRGQNLLTWTSEKIYKDPELIQLRGGGVMLKTWTAGVQLTF